MNVDEPSMKHISQLHRAVRSDCVGREDDTLSPFHPRQGLSDSRPNPNRAPLLASRLLRVVVQSLMLSPPRDEFMTNARPRSIVALVLCP